MHALLLSFLKLSVLQHPSDLKPSVPVLEVGASKSYWHALDGILGEICSSSLLV